ncbi:PAS domain S-box protein [Methylobacterium sp. JK268]
MGRSLREPVGRVARLAPYGPVTTPLAILCATVLASLAGIIGFVAWQSYAATLREARVAASNLARALDQHTARTLEAVDLNLGIVQLSIDREGLDSFVRGGQPLLARLADASPSIRSLAVMDEEGRVVADSHGKPAGDAPMAADRAFFTVQRDDPAAGLYISSAFRSRRSGDWTIVVSRRIALPDGRFGGVIAALLDPDYFLSFYKTMEVGPAGSVSLLGADGHVLVANPWRDDQIDRPSPGFGALPVQEPAATLVREAVDQEGIARLIAYRRAETLPLVAAVGLAREDVLAPWRHQVLLLTTIALGTLGVTGLIGLRFVRTMGRLRASESLFRAMFDSAGDGLFISRLEPDGTFRLEACNLAAATRLNAPSENLVGRPLAAVLPADYAGRVEVQLRRCLAAAAPLRFEEAGGPDGTERIWEVVLTPLRDEAGRPLRVLTSAREITHLKRAEAETAEANRRLLMAEEIAHVGHWRLALRDRRLTWSHEVYRIYGRDPETFAPTVEEAIACYHPDDVPVIGALVEAAISERQPYTASLRLVRPDGTLREVVARGLCESDEDGTVVALFGTLSDVTETRRVERAAAETAGLLATTLESMDQGLIVVSPEGRIEICNARAIALLDLPSDMMAGRPTTQAVLDHQWAAGEFDGADGAVRRLMLEGGIKPSAHTYTRTRPNGTVLEVRTVPMAGGGIVRTYTDITARRLAEEALRDSESRYRLIAENVSDVIALRRTDTDAPYLYVSPSIRQVLGCEPRDLMREEAAALVHPEDRPGLDALTGRLAAGEIAGERVTTTFRMRHRDGRDVWIEAGLSLMRDEAAGPPAILCSLRDVSARKAAEAALEASEARYRLLSENGSDMIIQADRETVRRYVSPACRELLGYAPEELIGTRPLDGVHPDDHAAYAAILDGLRHGRLDVATSRQRYRRRDGSYVWVEGKFRVLRDADGIPSGYVAAVRDVSERQLQAEALELARDAAEQASRAKTDFLASMSHEIRTPLNGILGYTDLLLDDPALGAGQRRQVERIHSAGAALLTIVNDILDFSKIEAGQVELDPQPFLLETLVDNTISVVRGFARRKSIAVSTRVDARAPRTLVGDQDRLRQILLNLLNNAVKFTPAGSVTLSIICEAPPDHAARLRFSVTDTGIGIPDDKRARLFQRFSQVDSSIRRDFGGTGLGLAISKNLVELMGGTIGVESVVSEGATFWFSVTLPVGNAVAAPAAPDRAETAAPPARILLVEDLEINQDIARAVLEDGGHRVDVVSDGLQAIVAVQAQPYDLVLMDVQMPGMDGITATRHIRALAAPAAALPIVAMTANVLPAQIAEFRAAGMDGHVGKPFKRDDLHRAVARWRRGREAVPEADPVSEPILDRAILEDVRGLVGTQAAVILLGHLADQINERLGEARLAPGDPERLGRDAHAITAAAGMLGFVALSRACAQLEAACHDGQDLDPAVARVRAARRRTLMEIEGLRVAA